MEIYGGSFDSVSVDEESALEFYSGTIKEVLQFSGCSSIRLIGGLYHSNVSSDWRMFLHHFQGTLSLFGGTYYFDPTSYLDTDNYKATKTKDADNVDIWVVTEK